MTPYEPLARVMFIRPIEPKPAAREEVIYGDGRLIRRYYETSIVVR